MYASDIFPSVYYFVGLPKFEICEMKAIFPCLNCCFLEGSLFMPYEQLFMFLVT